MAEDPQKVGDWEILKSLRQYENLRRNAQSISRLHNLEIVNEDPETAATIPMCHLVEMNRYSRIDRGKGVRVLYEGYALESLTAVALALEHLNTGNGSVVAEVGGLNERCPIRFTSEFFDTQGAEGVAVDRVIDITQRELSAGGPSNPCAFIGAFGSAVSVATSIVTGLRGYPQFSALSMTSQLNDKDTFPLFGRVVSSHDGFAVPLLDYIYNILGIRHFAVIHTDNTVGISYNSGIVATASKEYPGLVLRSVGYPTTVKTSDDFAPHVKALKDTGFRFFFAIAQGVEFKPLIEEALKQGIAGTGVHNWMFSNAAIPASSLTRQEWPEDSPLFQAGQGLMTFSAQGSAPGTGRYDEFAEALSHFADSPEDVAYLESKLPQHPAVPTYVPKIDAEMFRKRSRFFHFVPLVYDATILLGLAACNAAAAADADNSILLGGSEHYKSALNTTFIGASGQIVLNQDTGTRDAKSAVFGVTNVVSRPASGTNFSLVEERVGTFVMGEWRALKPVIFNDNTTGPVLDLPPKRVDYNYIGTGLRAAGLIMAGIIVMLSALFATWTYRYREKRVVKAAQPFFLLQICFGTLLMGCSIIPLSMDDEIASEQGNDVACMATPWLLSMGWVFSFSGLVAKTSRVNKVFHNPNFRRVKVTVLDVVKPMAALLLVNALILALWTALSPLEWSRAVLSEDRFGRPRQSQGYCGSNNSSLPYLICLVVIDLGVLVVACYQAYVARNIATEFAESESIAKAIVCILLVAFLGIPILYIAEQNSRAFYFVSVGNIFVICASLLCLIFIPKVIYQKKTNKKTVTDLVRRTITSSSPNPVSRHNGESTVSSGGEGLEVLEHPKLREDLKQLVTTLENRVGQLESIFEDDCEDEKTLRERYNFVSGPLTVSGGEVVRSNVASRATAISSAVSVAEGLESGQSEEEQ